MGGTRRIYLVRHGQSRPVDENGIIRNIPGLDLTEEGIRQAKSTARFLSQAPIGAIYSSDAPRAVKTAEIIAQELNLKVQTFPWLREFSVGDLEGTPFWEHLEEIKKITRLNRLDPYTRFSGGESIQDLHDRVIPPLKKLLQESPQHVCIVAHGGVNRVILMSLLNLPLDFFTRIDQENACVNIIDVSNDQAILRLLNFVPYDGVKVQRDINVYVTL